VRSVKYRVEIEEKGHKVVDSDNEAKLPDFIKELYRAVAKVYRTVSPEWMIKASKEAIEEAYA